MRKKIEIFAILPLIFPLCACNAEKTEQPSDFLTFTSKILNRNVNTSSDISCVLKSDGKAMFSYDGQKEYQWKESGGYGYEIKGGSKTIYVEFDKVSAYLYFYHEYEGQTHVFKAQYPQYMNSLASDYKPSYERLCNTMFEGNGLTSGVNTTAKLYLYDNEDKSGIAFDQGIASSPYETYSATLLQSWFFIDNTYSVTLANQVQLKSRYCGTEGKKGYQLKTGDMTYYHVVDKSFDWRDYTDSDFA